MKFKQKRKGADRKERTPFNPVVIGTGVGNEKKQPSEYHQV